MVLDLDHIPVWLNKWVIILTFCKVLLEGVEFQTERFMLDLTGEDFLSHQFSIQFGNLCSKALDSSTLILFNVITRIIKDYI